MISMNVVRGKNRMTIQQQRDLSSTLRHTLMDLRLKALLQIVRYATSVFKFVVLVLRCSLDLLWTGIYKQVLNDDEGVRRL